MGDVIAFCMVLGIIIWIIYFAFIYWKFTAPIVLLIILLCVWDNRKKKEKEQEEEKLKKIEEKRKEELRRIEEERKEKERLKKIQDKIARNLADISEKSLCEYDRVIKNRKSAESYLDQAEVDFSDGAFAPFWDSIERAAVSMGYFDEGVKRINAMVLEYRDLVVEFDGPSSEFPLSQTTIGNLISVNMVTERMRMIVRKAQCDFQFSMIFEQRKTNKILVAGFSNLAEALDGMAYQVVESIQKLSNSVDSMTSTIYSSLSDIDSKVGEIVVESIHELSNSVDSIDNSLLDIDSKVDEIASEISEERKHLKP